MIKEEGNVAAVLLEPVVGTNGIIVPPKEYYKMVREICDENDVLFIVDEVMSGWYRTGKPFAIEHWGVTPDILTTAKGASGAYIPLGVTATTKKIRDYFITSRKMFSVMDIRMLIIHLHYLLFLPQWKNTKSFSKVEDLKKYPNTLERGCMS